MLVCYGLLRSSSHISAVLARSLTILALESSADDTCAAVVTSNREILSNVVVKQNVLHESFGGIHPTVAIEAHQRNMPGTVRQALHDANISVNDVDGVAFTRGPGIGGCLSVCSNAAKSLAAALNKPVVGIHHMQAHALTPFLTSLPQDAPQFPFLTLLISGGHTLLVLAIDVQTFRILATTADESIGRSFDKVSRLLELRWTSCGPGAALEQFASEASDNDMQHIPKLPLPMPSRLAFSYAALHSAVERHIYTKGGIGKMDTAERRGLARAFQTAAVAQLEEKLSLGMQWCLRQGINVQHVVMSGGVASNSFLRARLSDFIGTTFRHQMSLIYPPISLCTDNAAMIAWAAMHRFQARDHDPYTIELRPKWSLEDLKPS